MRSAFVKSGANCPRHCGGKLINGEYRHSRSVALDCPVCGRGFTPDTPEDEPLKYADGFWKNQQDFMSAQASGFVSSY
jgi:hypothetical protein